MPATATAPSARPAVAIEYLHPWQGDHGGARAMAATAKRYRELWPNVEIKQTVVTGDEYERRQVAAFAAGVVPDLTIVFAETLPAYADRGALAPLDDRLRRDRVDLKDYFNLVVAQSSWAGRVYALTHHPDLRTVVFRNASLLEAAGIDAGREPTNWEELRALGLKATRVDGGRIERLGWAPPWVEAPWAVLFPLANGAELLDAEGRRVAFESPAALEALQFVVAATEAVGRREALLDFEQRRPGPGQETAYATGALALAIGGNWYLDRIASGGKPTDTRFGLMPGGPSAPGRSVALGGGALNVLPKGARQSDAAWEYALWIARPDGQMLIQDVSYDVAGHRQSANDPRIVNARLFRKELVAALEHATGPAHLRAPIWPWMRDEVARVQRALLMKQMTPRQGAAELQARFQGGLDNYRAQGRVLQSAIASTPAAHASGPSAPVPAPAGNLLRNAGFEGGSYRSGLSSSVAHEWSAWFQHRGSSDPGSWLPEPEYGIVADRPGQAHSGARAQRWFTSWAIHNGGVYQVVAVPPNAWLRFAVWTFSWSSDADRFGTSDGVARKWVGIDPEGGTDAFSPRIVWSSEDRTMDRWAQLAATAQARGDLATVFVRSQPDFALKHNDVLIDDAELTVATAPADRRAAELLAAPPPGLGPTAASAAGGSIAKAPGIGSSPTAGALDGSSVGAHAYFSFDYPGGETPYTINVAASPDDASALGRFGFRVYGPRWDDVYVMSGLRVGSQPNVVGTLQVGEAGRYLVDLSSFNPTGRIEYRIWLASKGARG